jgi:hypothetical protein
MPSCREKRSLLESYRMVVNEDGQTALEFNPKLYITNDLSETDIIQLKEVFDTFDLE